MTRIAAPRGYCTDGSGGENKLGQLLMQRRDELRALAAAAAAPPKPAAAATPPPPSVAAEPADGAAGDTKLGKRRSHDDEQDEGAMKPSKLAKPEDAADAGAEAHDVTVIE
jgi:hypothetical protein